MDIFWVAAKLFLLKQKLVPETYSLRSCPTLSLPSPPPPPPKKKMYFNFRMLLQKAIVAGVIIVPNLSLYFFFGGGGGGVGHFPSEIMSLVTVLQKKEVIMQIQPASCGYCLLVQIGTN